VYEKIEKAENRKLMAPTKNVYFSKAVQARECGRIGGVDDGSDELLF
jgi:hypothetical protein